jgi:hypothetical protein
MDSALLLTAWQAGAQPFDPAQRDLRMNRAASRFTSSALTAGKRRDYSGSSIMDSGRTTTTTPCSVTE